MSVSQTSRRAGERLWHFSFLQVSTGTDEAYPFAQPATAQDYLYGLWSSLWF